MEALLRSWMVKDNIRMAINILIFCLTSHIVIMVKWLSWMDPFIFAEYISPQGALGIKQYKYSSTNSSIYYKYVSGPLAAWLVDLLPRWVAPNVLTLMGFANVLIAYALVWFYCPTFTEQAPSWVWIAVALLLFGYRTLDNMDGKQARKIGCGSPLGLSLDHGCDAVTSALIPAIGCAFLQLGQSFWTITCIVTAPIGAFLLTWEEFYTGTFNLGLVNGVDEGGLFTDSMFMLGGLAGTDKVAEFTSKQVGYFFQRTWIVREVAAVGLVALVSFTVIPAIVNVIRTEKWKKAMFNEFNDSVETVQSNASMVSDDDSGSSPRGTWTARHYRGRRPRVRDAFNAALPVVLGSALWIGSVYFPFKQSGILLQHTRTVIWLAVMLYSKLITHLHIAHVCGDPYYQWRKTYLIPVALITINSVYSDIYDSSTIVDEVSLLFVCCIISTVSWMHMCYSVVTGMCEALDIPFLTVPKRCLGEPATRSSKRLKKRN